MELKQRQNAHVRWLLTATERRHINETNYPYSNILVAKSYQQKGGGGGIISSEYATVMLQLWFENA